MIRQVQQASGETHQLLFLLSSSVDAIHIVTLEELRMRGPSPTFMPRDEHAVRRYVSAG